MSWFLQVECTDQLESTAKRLESSWLFLKTMHLESYGSVEYYNNLNPRLDNFIVFIQAGITFLPPREILVSVTGDLQSKQ